MMSTKFCTSCFKTCLHNPRPKGEWRCTYCGHPVSTNIGMKREHQEELKSKQATKARLKIGG